MKINQIKTGDLILVQADSLLSLSAYHFLGIEYLHVGIAVWIASFSPLILESFYTNSNSQLYIWETDPIARLDILTNKEIKGCRIVPWHVLEDVSCEIAIRSIYYHPSILDILYEQIKNRHGQEFAKGGLGMLYTTLGYDYIPKHKTLHCTELVAEFLNKVMITFGHKITGKLTKIHLINPFDFHFKGIYNKILLDESPQIIVKNGWGLRASVIHFSLVLLLLIIFCLIFLKLQKRHNRK